MIAKFPTNEENFVDLDHPLVMFRCTAKVLVLLNSPAIEVTHRTFHFLPSDSSASVSNRFAILFHGPNDAGIHAYRNLGAIPRLNATILMEQVN